MASDGSSQIGARLPGLAQQVFDFLAFDVMKLSVHAPPPMDDFDVRTRLAWDGFLEGRRVGGRLQFGRVSEAALSVGAPNHLIRRMVAFTLLVQTHPAASWLEAALNAFRHYGPPPDDDTWHIGAPRPSLTFQQAVVRRLMDVSLLEYATAEALPDALELARRAAAELDLATQAERALAYRLIEIKREQND